LRLDSPLGEGGIRIGPLADWGRSRPTDADRAVMQATSGRRGSLLSSFSLYLLHQIGGNFLYCFLSSFLYGFLRQIGADFLYGFLREIADAAHRAVV